MSNCVVGSGSSRQPLHVIAEHGIERCDHLSHDGDDDDLGLLVGEGQPFGEGFEVRVVSACAKRSHVENVSDWHATTIDAAVPLELAAVKVVWSEADERGD